MIDENKQLQRLEARVRGRVQGVGFRDFVARRAQALSLSGAVWNGDDRALYVVAEGPMAALESLLAALGAGPPLAHVEGLDVVWGAAQGDGAAPFEVGG